MCLPGYTQSDIKNNGAWNKQFSITYDAQYSDKAAEGVIIAQSVKKGESVAQGTQIVLTVSKGIQTEEVPDVGGLDVAEAKKQLEAKGFKVTTVTVYNDGSYKEGTVKSVYGMTPDAKSTAAVGSEVVLQVYAPNRPPRSRKAQLSRRPPCRKCSKTNENQNAYNMAAESFDSAACIS